MHFIVGCGATRLVPKGKYLLKKNTITVEGDKIEKDDLSAIIRQQPNTEFLKMKPNLFFYNHIDSAKVANKRADKNYEIRHNNQKDLEKQNRINDNRIKKAREKNRTHYTEKIIIPKDTLEPNLFFREWLKYKIGEKPVVFDSTLYNKSIEQLGLYLKKKGYHFNSVHGEVKYKRFQKAKVKYTINTGKQFIIDSVYVDDEYIKSTNDAVLSYYYLFLENKANSLVGKPYDVDLLDAYRYKLARFMKDQAIFGYSPSHISFLVYNEDFNKDSMTVRLGIQLADRMVASSVDHDSLVLKKYQVTFVKDIYFHIPDTNNFKGNYSKMIKELGLTFKKDEYLQTFDTLFYKSIKKRNSEELDTSRMAYFLYNGEMFLNPALIEVQSMLSKNNLLTETNIEKSLFRLQQLGLFQSVKHEIIEVPKTNQVDVHFYLIPTKKETFSIQPRITTSNGYIGLSAGTNYTNKNMFRGAEKLTFSINGGFQSQPAIFDEEIDPTNIKEVTNKFYQLELGPSVKLELPGLFPIKKSKTNKHRLGKTTVSSAFSYQNRDVFSKKIFQMNYLWKYAVGRKQTFQIGLPFLSVIKFVNIQKSTDFSAKLNSLNDVFLSNTYSNQFIWQDFKLLFEFKDNSTITNKKESSFYYTSSFDLAGLGLSFFQKYQKMDSDSLYQVFNLVYSQFVRLDNEVIYAYPIGKKRSINIRGVAGAGVTYGNSKTSMPYDYSFFAGGSNDVRGWKARALGPGSYKYYIDTARTAIQVGDIRLSGSIEYRFLFSKFIKGAYFIDAGNIWTLRDDANRQGSKFTKDWYKELAIATGIGFRFDFDYFILRFDIGLPIHAPALDIGERWIFQKQEKFHNEINNFIMANPTMDQDKLDKYPFSPQLSFGIGYPF